jgi:hypothetical protein
MYRFTIETPANNKKGWRKLPDCQFAEKQSAENYGLKYHTDKSGSKMFRIVEIKDQDND